jgi:bifunctional ADP-heptose synthase (sugar kinase/adenylyltransferase)
VVVVAGDTVIAAVAAPLLQEYVPPPEAVSVADAPAQIVPSLLVAPDVSLTAMAADGNVFTVTVTEPVITAAVLFDGLVATTV